MENIIQAINQFRDERDWRQYHNEKDLALSVSLEAAELLELFQWEQPEDVVLTKRERLEEELADVFTYSLMTADNLNFDVEEIIKKMSYKC